MTQIRRISAFDLDHTLIEANSSLLFYYFLVKQGLFNPITILRTIIYSLDHRFFNLSLKDLHKKAFSRFLKGTSFKFVEAQVKKFLEEDFHRFIYYPAFFRLRRAQHEGHHTVMLSNSPSFIVGPIAKYLGMSSWGGSEYKVNSEGIFESVKSILEGEGKAMRLKLLAKQLNTKMEDVIAYSDSPLDLPFLKVAGKAVVVNPTRKMRKISLKQSWETI